MSKMKWERTEKVFEEKICPDSIKKYKSIDPRINKSQAQES